MGDFLPPEPELQKTWLVRRLTMKIGIDSMMRMRVLDAGLRFAETGTTVTLA